MVGEPICNDCDIPARIDVVATYTSAAAQRLLEDGMSIETYIAEQVASIPNANLVYTSGVHYDEVPDSICELYGVVLWLGRENDGVLDMASDWREQYGGDVLIFVGNYPESGCVAQSTGFADYDCEGSGGNPYFNTTAGIIAYNADHWDHPVWPLSTQVNWVIETNPWEAADRFCSIECPEDYDVDGVVSTTDLLAALEYGTTMDVLQVYLGWGSCEDN
jgi:hypothetical protein